MLTPEPPRLDDVIADVRAGRATLADLPRAVRRAVVRSTRLDPLGVALTRMSPLGRAMYVARNVDRTPKGGTR